MSLAKVKFFEDPREFTDEQIEELRVAGLLAEDKPAEGEATPVEEPGPVATSTPPAGGTVVAQTPGSLKTPKEKQ